MEELCPYQHSRYDALEFGERIPYKEQLLTFSVLRGANELSNYVCYFAEVFGILNKLTS